MIKLLKNTTKQKMLTDDVRLPEQKNLVKAVESLLSKEQPTPQQPTVSETPLH